MVGWPALPLTEVGGGGGAIGGWAGCGEGLWADVVFFFLSLKSTEDNNYVNIIFQLCQFCRSQIMSLCKNYLILLKFVFFNDKNI